jgi:hypothetical protein
VTGVGILNEHPLHAALKARYCGTLGRPEADIDGFVVDVALPDEVVEIQTSGFARIRGKLEALLVAGHRVRLVHPVAGERWIVKLDGETATRRKSPHRGGPLDVCRELVSFPQALRNPGFLLDVAVVAEEQLRRRSGDGRGWRRGGWVIVERRLLDVSGVVTLAGPDDLAALLPDGLPDPFTTADLAEAMHRPRGLARAVAYCLRHSGAAEPVGRDRSGIRYRLV